MVSFILRLLPLSSLIRSLENTSFRSDFIGRKLLQKTVWVIRIQPVTAACMHCKIGFVRHKIASEWTAPNKTCSMATVSATVWRMLFTVLNWWVNNSFRRIMLTSFYSATHNTFILSMMKSKICTAWLNTWHSARYWKKPASLREWAWYTVSYTWHQ